MKLHLPVRLFRAIIALMVTAPVVMTYAEGTTLPAIPDGYQTVYVDSITDITDKKGTESDIIFLLQEDIDETGLSTALASVGSASRIFTSADLDCLSSLSISSFTSTVFELGNSKSLTFADLDNFKYHDCQSTIRINYYGMMRFSRINNISFLNGTSSSYALSAHNIYFEGNGNVQFDANNAAKIISAGNLTFKNNSSIDFIDAKYSSEGGAISTSLACTFENNIGIINFKSCTSTQKGGAIYSGGLINFINNTNINFESNFAYYGGGSIYAMDEVLFNGNDDIQFYGTGSSSPEEGGAIYGTKKITFGDNGNLTFKLYRSSSGQYTSPDGGAALYSDAQIQIIHNKDVEFSSNVLYVCHGSSGPAIYSGSALTVFDNGNVKFCENTIDGYYSVAGSYSHMGGAVYVSGDCNVGENDNVLFSKNTIDSPHGSGYGGAIRVTGSLNFDDNLSLTFENNTIKVPTSAHGGAIYANSVTISENPLVMFDSNGCKSTASYSSTVYARGGAVYAASDVYICDNGQVSFFENYVESAQGWHQGGAIYANNVYIQNNESVVFQGNSPDAVYQASSSGKLVLSAESGKSITFYDSIVAQGTVEINSDYDTRHQSGKITLIRNTATVAGNTNLNGGEFSLEYRAKYTGHDFFVNTSDESTTTLKLKHSNMELSGAVKLQSGTCLDSDGINDIKAGSLILNTDSSLAFNMMSDHRDVASLTLTGSFAQEGSLTLNISFNDTEAEAGLYKLMTVTSIADDTLWTSSNVTVNGLDGYVVSFDDLEWKDNTLYLNYNGTPGTGGATTPTLLIATWTNEAGDGLWNGTSLNWEQEEVDYAYKDGVQVVFGDEGAGTVTLVGDIAPSSVLVDSKEDYTWNADSTAGGKLTGSMSLTKKGTGTLIINTENDYSGGTTIQGGTVVAGTATALGIGTVSLTDATLKIDAEGVENALTTAGTSSILVQDGGSLALQSAITNAATGILTLSGKVDVSGIGELTKLDATLIDVNGNAGTSGFARTEGYTLQVVKGGKVLGAGAQLEHRDLPTGLTLVLGENGLATAGAATDFTKYVVTGSHAVSVSEILKDVPQGSSLSSIEMSGGTLLVDAATDALAATAGTVTLNKDVTLGGTMSGGLLMAQAGEIAATLSGSTAVVVSGAATLSGGNSYSGGVMLNGGALTLKHAQALGSGQLVSSGTSSLLVDSGVELSLGQAISNSGKLSISGSIHATGTLNTEAATRVDVNGASGTSGFKKDALEWVQIVNGGVTLNLGTEISHDSATDTLVLGSDGRATCGGAVHYDEYLLTGTGVADVQEIMDAAGSELTSIEMQGGTLTVNADTAALLEATDGVIMLGNGGTIGSGSSVSGVDIKASGGSIAATLTGSNTLEGVGDFALGTVIANNGTLVLSGNIKADALNLVEEEGATFIDVNGNSGSSGFSKSAQMSVQLTSGTGTTIDGGVTISHKDATDTLVLGKNGKAGYGGEINYTNYLLNGENDSASVSGIIADAGDALTNITVQQGTLTVDAVSKPVTATGGAVVLDGGVLNGTLTDTVLTLKNGTLGTASITGGTVTGVDYALGSVLNVSGTVGVSGSFNASLLQLVSTDATRIDVNGNSGASGFLKAEGHSVQVFNGGTLNVADGTTVKHGGVDLLLGSNGYASAGGGITWSEYLLTGSDTADTSAIYDKSATAAIIQTGGTLAVDGDAEVTTTAGAIELESGSLSGTISGAAITATGGSLAATLSGSNTLEGQSGFALDGMIANNGTLTLSGSIKADALSLYTEDATHIDVNGNSGASGFSRSALASVQLTSGTGTTIDGGVTISHKDATDTLVLGKDGKAGYGGEIDYTNYLLNGSGDSASVSAIIADAGDALTGITVQQGTLTVDAVSKPVTATGGAVVLDGGVLNGTLTDTALTLKNGSLGTASITGGTVTGVDYVLGSVLSISGNVAVSGSFNASLLHLASTDATRIDVNGNSGASGFLKAEAHSVQVFNGGTLDIASGTTVKHGSIDLLLGNDGYATAGGGITWCEYLLTGEDCATASSIYQKAIDEGYNGAVSITQKGGALTVTADAEVTTTAGSINLTGGTLTGTISGATLSVSGGSMTATLSGSNTLTGSNYTLSSMIVNNGTLVLSGSIKADALSLYTEDATHIDVNGNSGASGFSQSALESVQLTSGTGSTVDGGVTITHRGATGELVLGTDGSASRGGEIDYTNYLLNGESDSASVSDIIADAGDALTGITVKKGTLTVDAVSKPITATGGAVVLDGGVLNASLTGASLTLKQGSLGTAAITGGEVIGDDYLLGAVLNVSGEVNISGSFNASALQLSTTNATRIDVNDNSGASGFLKAEAHSVQVFNGGTLDIASGTTVKHGSIDLLLGNDGYATAGGGITWSEYLLTGTDTADTSAIYGKSATAVIVQTGGTLTVDCDAEVTTSAGIINLNSDVTLGGSISGATVNASAGTLAAALSGNNALVGNAYALSRVLNNTGTLTMSGTFTVNSLTTDEASTYVGIDGCSTSGYAKDAYKVATIATGTTADAGATITYNGENLKLNTDGTASAGGTVHYDTFWLKSDVNVATNAIHALGSNALVDVTAGTLTVNDATQVKATAGSIVLDGGVLNGSIENTTLTLTSGTVNATISGGNVIGNNYALAEVLQVSGDVSISGSFVADNLELTTIDARRVDVVEGNSGASGFLLSGGHRVLIINGGTLDIADGTMVTHGSIDLTLGSDGYATSAGSIGSEYLLVGTDAVNVAAILEHDPNATINMQGGTLTVDAATNALTATGGTIKLDTDVTLGGTISGATISASKGTLSAALSGNNTLVGNDFALNGVLSNIGTLTLSGSIKADALDLVEEEGATFIDVNGNSGASGFSKSALISVQLTSGTGTTIDGGVTISHKDATDTLLLGADGKAGYGGEIDYTNYLLNGSGDSASVSAIIADAGDALASITVQQGTLTVDAVSKPVTATGGAVVLDGGVLNGTLTDTVLTLKNGMLGTASITGGTVTGVDFVLGSVLNVSGNVAVSGSFNASLLQLVSTDATRIDVDGNSGASGFLKAEGHSVQVFNGGTLNVADGTTVKHGGVDLLLGSNGYATAGGGTNWTEYLLTGSDTADTSAIYDKSATAAIIQTGGTLTVDGDAEVTTTAGAIELESGSLSGTITGAAITATGGSLAATLSGNNTLVGDGYVLNSKLNNTGTLTLSGSFSIGNGLIVQHTDAGYESLNGGYDATNGFARTEWYSVDIADGGTADANATITYNGKTLKLGHDGVATHGGEVDYTMYYLNSGELSTKRIHDKVAGADITLKGGALTVETQSTVTAIGGAINLVENGVLNGSLTNTNLTLTKGTLNAELKGGNTIIGAGYVLSEMIQNSGSLTVQGSFDASGLQLMTESSSRVDVVAGNSGASGFLKQGDSYVQIIKGGTLIIDGATVSHEDAVGSLTLGTDGYARSTGGTNYGEYLLVGNDTVNVAAILTKNSSATINMQGGTLNVDAATNALTATAGTINLHTVVELGGSISGATINASKGTLVAALSGSNTLVGTGYALNGVLNNSGKLTLSGTFTVNALTTDEAATYVGIDDCATSGFAKDAYKVVKIANGTTIDGGATIKYGEVDLKLNADGTASAGGTVHYDTFWLKSDVNVDSATIHGLGANALVDITSGTLTVNDETRVNANGGSIELISGGMLNGTLNGTALTLKDGTVNASISGGSVAGADYALNEILQVSGNVSISGSFNADKLQLMTEGVSRVDVVEGNSGNSGFLKHGDSYVLVISGGSLTIDGATVSHKDAVGSLTLGTDGYARSTGGTEWSEYLLTGRDRVATQQIHAGDGVGATVRQEGGQLTVNDATTVTTTAGTIILSGATLSGSVTDARVTAETGVIAATLSGITAVTVTDNVSMSGDNSHSGVTTLADATLTITHANALGTGDIVSTGDSELEVDGVTLVLGDRIANTGELTLSGSIDASGLTLNRSEEGRVSLDGTKVSLAESGFARGVEYSVQIVDGGTTVNAGAGISHKDYLSRTQLVLGDDGVARAGGAVDYTHFFLTGGDAAVVSEIAAVSTQHQETLTGVTMDSGTLEVDQSMAVNATDGSIIITKEATLSGSIEDAAVSTAAGDYASEISALLKGDTTLEVNGGNITVSGDNSYTDGTVVNGGALLAGHNKAFGAGDVTVNGATLDLNRFTVANKVTLNGNSTLGHANGASHIVLGGGSNVNVRDGFAFSSGKVLEVAAGGATYTGALTLGGGTLELDGLLTVQGDVVFSAGTQTTIDISGWAGADDGDVLATLGSSNSGYTDESLKLAGIAGEWELDFDAASGTLTLVAVQDEPLPELEPEPEFNPVLNGNQQIVYDTIEDIMGEGNPGGLLGELGKEVTDTRDEEKLKQLLDELGGAEYATLLSGQQAAARAHMGRLRGTMGSGYMLAGEKTRAYIEAYNHRSEVDGDDNGRGYELNESGGQFALEFLGKESVSGGFAVAAGHSKLQPDSGLTQKSDNTYVDAFLIHRDGAYTAKFSLGVGVHKYDLDRRVAGNAVEADASGSSVNFMHESAWGMELAESHSVQFFGAVESTFNKLGAFSEKGADTASLQVEGQDAWVTTLSAGARYQYSFAALDSAPVATLSLQAGLEFDFGDTDGEVEMSFKGARRHSFRQSGAERDTFGYNLGASLHVPVSAKAAIYASGDAVLRGDSYEVNANVGLQMAF